MGAIGRLVAFTLGLLIALSIGWSAPVAAQTADEYADGWTEAHRGDRTWEQRATEQLTTGITERVMGRPPTGPMKEAHNHILTKIEQLRREVRNPCLAAAVEQAHSQALATGRQEVMAGAFSTLTSALGGAASGGEIRSFLGRRLLGQVREVLQGRALDEFKDQMRDAMKRGLPDYWSDSNNSNACQVEYRGVWDKAAERYHFIIAGDCACNDVLCGPNFPGTTAKLRRWTVEGWGTIIPEIDQLPNGEKRIRYGVGLPQDVHVTADCCGRDEPLFRTHPNTGPGNSWVGFVRQPQTTPPQTQPPRRPQTGGTPPATGAGQTGTTPRPTRPPSIDIPVIPDGPLTDAQIEDLEQRVFTAEELAQSERQRAESRAIELERSGASADAQAEARAAAEAASDTHRRARAAREELQRRVNEQANQQQSALPADSRMQVILAEHNKARAEVGVPRLQWNPALAAGAMAYASELARTGRRVHAPREGRGAVRENLNQGMLGWNAGQMVQNWLKEERNFYPGTYPDVTRTGRWQDVSHYTQMIWPATTQVGCGLASGSGYQWLVCRYSPGGNKDGQLVGLPSNQPALANDSGIAPPNSSTPTIPRLDPRDLPRDKMGGGMTQIDPPAPPPPPLPTARDPAPDDIESRHPLHVLAYAAFDRHAAAVKACDQEAARRALDEMRHAVSELEKRFKTARKLGRFSAINPDAVEQSLREARDLLRRAEDRSRAASCPPLPPPPPLPPVERG